MTVPGESSPPAAGPPAASAEPALPATTSPRGRTVGEALSNLSVATGTALLGALLMAAGSVGPWIDTFLGSRSGTSGGGDGLITLAAAAIAFLVTLGTASQKKGARVSPIMALLAGLAGGAIGVIDLIDIHGKIQGTEGVSVGWGIYAVIVGAAVIIGAIVVADKERR